MIAFMIMKLANIQEHIYNTSIIHASYIVIILMYTCLKVSYENMEDNELIICDGTVMFCNIVLAIAIGFGINRCDENLYLILGEF